MLTLDIIDLFSLPGKYGRVAEINSGLINSTYKVTRRCENGKALSFIFQRINQSVFKNAEAVMQNIAHVTDHLSRKSNDAQKLRLIPLTNGENFYKAANNDIWRCYTAIEDCVTYDVARNKTQAYEAARAFGQFIFDLSDLDPGLLTETIPNFHNTPLRFQTLLKAAKEDPYDRVKDVKDELTFIEERRHELSRLENTSHIPKRIVHYDTKINNVMFHATTGKAVCVIDLDTVMPGYISLDFGDLVRTAACSVSEEETDLSQVSLDLELYGAIYDGFLGATQSLITQAEKEILPFSSKLITLELAIRFLTDYILGDRYFRTNYPSQNLDRAKNQMTLVKSMEEKLSLRP